MCCRDDAAFNRLRQLFLEVETRQPTISSTLGSLDYQAKPLVSTIAKPFQASGVAPLQFPSASQSLLTISHQASEQYFWALIENATDIIVILDAIGTFLFCSPSAERILGYTLADVVGRSAIEFVHPDDVPVIMQALEAAVANPYMSQPRVEYRVRHADGSWRFFEAITTSLLENPVVAGVVVNCHDVTERRQSLSGLLAANQQIASLLEGITDAFFSLDYEWRFTYMNQQAGDLFQLSPTDVLGREVWLELPYIVGTSFEENLRRSQREQTSLTFEKYCDVFNAWLEIRILPVKNGLLVFLSDVSDRHQVEVELLEMSSALGNAVEGIARLDTEGRYIALNRAYATALGYLPEEMIGMSWEATVYPEDLPEVRLAYKQMLAEGKTSIETQALRKDGSTYYKEVVLVPTHDLHDNFIGHHCFMRDITERKHAEVSLRQQAERERLLGAIARRIRNSLDLSEVLTTAVAEVRQLLKVDRTVIFQFDSSDEGVTAAESIAPEILAISPYRLSQSLVRRHFQTTHHNHVINQITQQTTDPERLALLQSWQVKSVLNVPIMLGEYLWGVLACHQCTTSHEWESYEVDLMEQLATHLAIAIQQSNLYRQVQQLNSELEQQVQERTAQLQQSLQYEAMLKRITDTVRDSLDEEQILQRAVQELTQGLLIDGCDAALYQLEPHLSTVCYEFIRQDLPSIKGQVINMADLPEIYDQLLTGLCFQFCRIAPDTIRSLHYRYAILACPLVGDQGVIGDLWLFKPRSELFTLLEIRLVQQVANQCAIAIRQARLYQAAQAQVKELEKLNQLKDDFLSTVSHELRTPMSNMKMAIHMLRNVTIPERQQRYLGILQAECTREIELINDLLDLQRLEAASYQVMLEPIDLQSFLPKLMESFKERCRDRQQRLQAQPIADIPPMMSDRSILERVLAELLNNACKYTPPSGEIIVEVGFVKTAAKTAQYEFRISNQAEIPAQELPRLFEKFYRVPASDRWQQGGTGLGLALVQRLLEQLQGSIQVVSQASWTTFVVNLPQQIT
jgi:PAS domain S-box-containing protein